MRRIAIGLTLLGLLMAACGGDGVLKIKDPGPVPSTTTTSDLDYGAIGLKGVSSRTTTSISIGPGKANLSGTVAGPEGAVPGATVRVERLIGTSIATMDLATQPDGTWTLPAVLGGRYRLRAWRAPDLAQVQPETLFLESSQTKAVNLRVDRFAGVAVTPSIAPDPPPYDEPANLYVRVSERSVNPAGVVTSTPLSGISVELRGSGFQVETVNPAISDANGVAEWRVRCTTYSAASLFVTFVGSPGSLPVPLPACIDPNAPPTTVLSASTTSIRRSTSTTRR